jgi:hypothetical protein
MNLRGRTIVKIGYYRLIAVLLLALFVLHPEKAGASTKTDPNIAKMDFVRVIAVGKNINLRDKPSIKGRVLGQVSGSGGEYETEATYIAVSPPVKDKSDNSTWYKLFFALESLHSSFIRLDKIDLFNFTTPYINAKFVKKVPLTEFDREQIEYFRQGRPPRYKTGDLIEVYIDPEWDRIVAIKKPLSLYLEPKKNAEKRTFPVGTKVIVYGGPGMGWPDYMRGGGALYWHMDMDDDGWFPAIGENRRIIGWAESDIKFVINWRSEWD